MIHGAHVIIYSKDADADCAFIRDVLGFTHVDVGGGWLIFGLPPAEVAVHPTEGGGSHELYLMCDDIEKFRAEMAGHGVSTGASRDEGWGVLSEVVLPSGAKLGVYEPRHARPGPMSGAPAVAKAKRRGTASATKAGAKGKRPAAKASAKRPAANASAKRPAAKASAKRPAAKASAKRGGRTARR